ncbi:MAG: Asparagine synthetase (glutamine-hydrolyzing) 1 [candidate division WS6 bacterium OLB20]|uniref:asparagine synthase (glutamine-hydrolyzing) n=1 Tax=candidate division WS6 bacterium OLB20 TaxID=1617426 RepID=A0A136LWT6_9BACT|nr:MAG: Asparagine synthetase (glutamine-hydrolyzing) 1 [candidate division WS6 bacterium OLB20]
MCGIAGFTKQDKPLITRLLDTIEHRGPDGQGVFVDGHVSLGMRRLAIIDPEGGKQPIWNADKTRCIFFNGEIYNYQELWKDLQAKGYRFSTDHSDTETILLGFEAWGKDVLLRLRGMFAFVIYDTRTNQLFIARDRLGIKPLYYTHHEGVFYFASELKQLSSLQGFKRTLDPAAASAYLHYRVHDATEHTFFLMVSNV